jgi:hypothetical protein
MACDPVFSKAKQHSITDHVIGIVSSAAVRTSNLCYFDTVLSVHLLHLWVDNMKVEPVLQDVQNLRTLAAAVTN